MAMTMTTRQGAPIPTAIIAIVLSATNTVIGLLFSHSIISDIIRYKKKVAKIMLLATNKGLA